MTGTPVLVTTSHRGVFFGRLEADADVTARTLTLTHVRNAIHWSGPKGFLGLAADGPGDGSRIGATATLPVVLHDITSVSYCTPEAAKKWEEWK